MAKTVFVLVYGFGPTERHAIKSMFELSRERQTVYLPWREGAARRASIILVDGSSEGARRGFSQAMAERPDLLPIWVVNSEADEVFAPPNVLDVFLRPIDWQGLIGAMDTLFNVHGHDSGAVDLDLDRIEATDTTPDVIESVERMLLVEPSRDRRLFIRAAMAARGYCELDDVESCVEGRSLLHHQGYAVAMINVEVEDPAAWELVATARNRMAATFVMGDSMTLRLKAWSAGAHMLSLQQLDLTSVAEALSLARS